MNATFKETQKISGWILWLIMGILIPLNLLIIYGIYKQMILGEPFGGKPGSDSSLIFLMILLVGLTIFFLSITLKTEINKKGIRIHLFPFSKKMIKWDDIATVEIIDYGFVGGWGLRFTQKYGTAYNMKGKIGLLVQLNNGKKYLVGTQKPDELEAYLKT